MGKKPNNKKAIHNNLVYPSFKNSWKIRIWYKNNKSGLSCLTCEISKAIINMNYDGGLDSTEAFACIEMRDDASPSRASRGFAEQCQFFIRRMSYFLRILWVKVFMPSDAAAARHKSQALAKPCLKYNKSISNLRKILQTLNKSIANIIF